MTWQNFEIFENLGPGSYSILARRTDIDCQIALDTLVVLGEGMALEILEVFTIDRDVCNNFGGEIEILTNIFTDLEYSIDNGVTWQLDNRFTDVPVGTYTVMARTLNLACQTIYFQPVVINEAPRNEILDVLVSQPTNCNSSNGTIFIDTDAGFNTEFSIDNGATYQSNAQFQNLPAGTYFVRVRVGNCEIDYAGNPIVLGAPNTFSVLTPLPNAATCTDTLMSLSVTLSDVIDSYEITNGMITNVVLNGNTLSFDAVVTDIFNEYELTFTSVFGCEVTESFTIFQATDTEADFVVIEPFCREMEVNLLFTGTATPMAVLDWELDGGVLVSSSPATATAPAGSEIVVRWDDEGSRLILSLIHISEPTRPY